MILITGARGAVATRLTALLHADGLPLRLASAHPDDLIPPPGVPTTRLALTDPADFPTALADIKTVFLYASPDRITDFVDHAQRAGVEHIVLLSSSSVLGPAPEDDPLAASHLTVEKALLASPITTTILRPGSFASNAGAWAWPIKAGRPVSLPFPDAHNDPIHERDVAEAARAVLSQPRHHGGRFTLSGPESLSFSEQIDRLAAVTGSPATIKQVTRDEWKREMADYIPAGYADALLNWWESNDGKPVALTSTVEKLTGSPARPFTTWAADHVADFTID
ncbi:NAD(P)H-binding protein [Streptomyces flavofungini]|uniref:NAD(P)H-binding protein n=1 Tax=Streptomyces flavofungini TaxID=68200 RepID=A0ABS0X0X7_9ACTN|nr:NAD(P)H-binding protein [Streptomyces flavofungini]MBJ3806829.1 NAD(P)H-binding protein [Streptomyces flavofungini]GHC60259.1 nucleotide-diphosphate-sugar epimerase [Streptomyces flavofungini]